MEEEKLNSPTSTSTPYGYFITNYGESLFQYFCNNPSRKCICIKNFKTLPFALMNALFNEPLRGNQRRLSIIPILRIFQFVQDVVLNDLNTKQFNEESIRYVFAAIRAMQYIEKHNDNTCNELSGVG
eukprot:144116_1